MAYQKIGYLPCAVCGRVFEVSPEKQKELLQNLKVSVACPHCGTAAMYRSGSMFTVEVRT